MITNLVGGVFDLLGRAGGVRSKAEESEGEPDGYANRFAVPVGRVGYPASDEVADNATTILDANMRHSPNPRTGRIERGIYRGKTPAEAALAARREAENQRRNTIGGGDVGRIGSDRSDYEGRGGGFSVPLNRASAGLDRIDTAAKGARESAARRATGDMRGVSFWRNNGDGTATSGRYGADNKPTVRTGDIVSRVRPGETRVMAPGERAPKGADKNTHLFFEGMRGGHTKVQAMRTHL